MAAEEFYARWSRRKTASSDSNVTTQPQAFAEKSMQSPAAMPASTKAVQEVTMEDVEKLTAQSDYAPFMARGVDENIKRSAMKKLFADPHYNVMDGLDIYIDDYSKFEPIPAAMLAIMNHAKALLDPLGNLEQTANLITHGSDDSQQPEVSAPPAVEQMATDMLPASSDQIARPDASDPDHPDGADHPAPEISITQDQPHSTPPLQPLS